MIITALKLQEATKEAVHDELAMAMASQLFIGRNIMTDEEFTRMLFEYSAMLASLTATLATNALLTEEQVNDMINEIKEFEQIGKDIENGK